MPKGARRVWSDGVASLFLTAWRGPDGELLIDLDWRITPPGKAPSLAQVA